MWRLVAKGTVPQSASPPLLAVLQAHHHHACNKERHAMLEARAEKRAKKQRDADRLAQRGSQRKKNGASEAGQPKRSGSFSNLTAAFGRGSFAAASLDRVPIERAAAGLPDAATAEDGSEAEDEFGLFAPKKGAHVLDSFAQAPGKHWSKAELMANPELLNDPDPESMDHDDDALDVLVGVTPFLTSIATAFVRLKTPVVLGDFSEEGTYEYLFLTYLFIAC